MGNENGNGTGSTANLADVRKEHARELSHEIEAERHRVCLAWLPVLDGLESALDAPPDEVPAALIGVRSVRDQAVALLASLGFPRDDEVGVPFDPQRHEIAELIDDPSAAPGRRCRQPRPPRPTELARPATSPLTRWTQSTAPAATITSYIPRTMLSAAALAICFVRSRSVRTWPSSSIARK